jgi:hypothetical protein
MSKHTYLFPLPVKARLLWRLGRANASDLFGYPDSTHAAGWHTTIRLDEEFARARAAVMRLIENAPRVCIGFGYTIPDSVSEEPDYHDTHESTRILTRRLWDGEVVDERLHRYVMGRMGGGEVPDQDPADTIADFLAEQHGQMIIPVWM